MNVPVTRAPQGQQEGPKRSEMLWCGNGQEYVNIPAWTEYLWTVQLCTVGTRTYSLIGEAGEGYVSTQ